MTSRVNPIEIAKFEYLVSLIESIDNVMKENRTFYNFINHPVISFEDKALVIQKLFKQPIQESYLRVIGRIISRRHATKLTQIAWQLKKTKLLAEHKQAITVQSATALSAQQQELLCKKLSELFVNECIITFEINQKLLSGIKIKIGSLVIENSLFNTIQLCHQALSSVYKGH